MSDCAHRDQVLLSVDLCAVDHVSEGIIILSGAFSLCSLVKFEAASLPRVFNHLAHRITALLSREEEFLLTVRGTCCVESWQYGCEFARTAELPLIIPAGRFLTRREEHILGHGHVCIQSFVTDKI